MKDEPQEINVDNFDNLDLDDLDLDEPSTLPGQVTTNSNKPVVRSSVRFLRVASKKPPGNLEKRCSSVRRVGVHKLPTGAVKPKPSLRSVVVERRERRLMPPANIKALPAQGPTVDSLPHDSLKPDTSPLKNRENNLNNMSKGKHPTAPKRQPPQPGREGEILTIGSFKPDDLLIAPEVVQILGISPKTLANWRWKGKGPRFVKIGGAVRYQVSELNSYINSGRRCSTSGEGG